MVNSHPRNKVSPARLAAAFAVLVSLVFAGGCSKFVKSKVTVPPRLTPLVGADTAQLFAEINRMAAVQSLNGKIDVQFLDTSFAECGIAEKYRTAEGSIIVQRPGQVYLAIQAPFSYKIAEMTSDGERFRVAVYRPEEYKRFLMGTNMASYSKLPANGGAGDGPRDCGKGGKDKMNVKQTVSALSGLRPQHFTDALLVRPVAPGGADLIYAQSESFEEEPDSRPGAKGSARVVRGYYVLVELAPQGEGRARVLRRFWFDRVGALRLARVQNYDGDGRLVTDVVYGEPQGFGEDARHRLPSKLELTRPQEGYSIRIGFQSPEAVKVDRPYDKEIFVLQNTSSLPEADLDAQKK